MKFRTLKNENLSEKIANEIIQMLNDGTLQAGEKLPPEPELALAFGISRGILREALTILTAKGYLRRTPGHGTFIRDMPKPARDGNCTVNDLFKMASYRDILQVRRPLEELCVELVVARATDAELDQLHADIMALTGEQISDIAEFTFHLRLAELSKNVLLINLISSYSVLINEFAHEVYAIDERYKASLQEHAEIVRKIKTRDVETAKKAIRSHLQAAHDMLIKNSQSSLPQS